MSFFLVHLLSDGFSVQSVQGMLYNPLSGAWCWTDSTAINYALHAVKLRDDPQPDQAEESGSHPEEHTAATHSWAEQLENKSENRKQSEQMSGVPPTSSLRLLKERDEIELEMCCTKSRAVCVVVTDCQCLISHAQQLHILWSLSNHHLQYWFNWISFIFMLFCDLPYRLLNLSFDELLKSENSSEKSDLFGFGH